MADAYRDRRRRPLRRLINVYITSYDVRLAHAHRANQNSKRNERLPPRELPGIAHRVNLLRPCDEPVRVIRIKKDGGGFREITVPGIVNKTRSMILKSVLKLARDRIPGNAHYTGNGGNKAAVRRIKEMVADPAMKWLVESDIRDFFGMFDDEAVVAMICELLPIDPRAVRYTALASHMNYPSGPKRSRWEQQGGRSNYLRSRKRTHTPRTRRQAGLAQHPNGCPVDNMGMDTGSTRAVPTVGNGRRGLPQGLPASPLIAELLVAPSLAGHGVVYCDNVFQVSATLGEARTNDEALVAVLRDHRAGPFSLKPQVRRRLDHGADVLGTRMKKKRGVVTTGPTKGALRRFREETWSKPAAQRKAGKKLNKAKLIKKGRGMARAMPVDAEARWWLEQAAIVRPDQLTKWQPEEVRVQPQFEIMHDYLVTFCGFAA